MRTALTIAGSDSGGGAGIQADLKTFAAYGVFGTSAITAITAQNTLGVTAVHALPPELVVAQIDAVVSDLGADATKIGMLANTGIIEAVAEALTRLRLPHIVLDPVMVAKGGDHLLETSAVQALRDLLLPLALVVTPNVPVAPVTAGAPAWVDGQIRAIGQELARDHLRPRIQITPATNSATATKPNKSVPCQWLKPGMPWPS